jgi:PAS domain S-box-containing protein
VSMATDKSNPSATGLRRQAEAILRGDKHDLEGFSPHDLQELVHELQVHQIELELQNDALRETQQALELARDEYAALYDGAPVGYFTVDGDGLIVRANATGAALLAGEPNTLIGKPNPLVGKPFHSLVAHDDQEAYHLFLVRLLGRGGPETVELFLVRRNGGRFRARIEGVVSAGEQRDNHRWRAAVSDVTAKYEARQAVQRYADEVSDLLRQREETQAMLVQTEKVAALGRLSASLSHEINNPLQSVLGCLGLAQGELELNDDRQAAGHYLAVAMQEIRRIAVLVHRMREFYTQGGEERVTGDIENVLERVVDLTRGEFKGRHVELEWERAGRLPMLPMLADQMQQVFLNLILNAAEAMPDGGTVILRAGVSQMPAPGAGEPRPAVRIDVQDMGHGMPPEVQKRLFEPFFTTKPGGSGLGLYICYRIVQEHGGEIEVQSHEGEGTTASVWLPIDSGS